MDPIVNVSVILPVHNAELWLDDCLASVVGQRCQPTLRVELSVFLDSCEDSSEAIVTGWIPALREAGFKVTISKGGCHKSAPRGVGYAKNRSVEASFGEFLCFMDADDIMLPTRIQTQYDTALKHKKAIVGARFRRSPEGSTRRFTKWANSLTPSQLYTQAFTSNGPTVIMPTWFCHRSVFDSGGFDEGGRGTPEDLIFFYRHLRLGGEVVRTEEELLVYRHHNDATTFSIHEETIWRRRVREMEERVLVRWPKFTIWNAGKQGRKFFRSIRKENQKKVVRFCDVDPRKIGNFYTYEESEEIPKPKIFISHFKEAEPPFVICVKLDLTNGSFEKNLSSLNLKEGIDYYHFN